MPSHALDDSVPAVPLNSDRLCAGALFVAMIAACGSDPRLRVDDSVLERITIENKLLLFDAENELDIAIDDKDQVTDALEALAAERRRVEEERERARRDRDLFRDKGDTKRARVAELRIAAAEARIDHIEALRDAEKVRLERQERALVVARARFELAKARLVSRNNVPGAADLDLDAFERQVDDYLENVEAIEPKLIEAEDEAAEREAAWAEAAARLREASDGAFGSRWLD